MDRIYGLDVPSTLSEVCRPERLALVVYDMQAGILGQPQFPDRDQLVEHVRDVLGTARGAGVRTFFIRHTTPPVETMGVHQLRLWRTMLKLDRLEDVTSPLPPDAPQTQIVPEVAPTESEPVIDKTAMSAFAGTRLELALRGCDVNAVALVGVATEIGIDITVRHAGDLGFIPVVITDACAVGNAEAAARTLAHLEFLGDAMLTDVAGFREALGAS
jgi:biuret amidohydrolase